MATDDLSRRRYLTAVGTAAAAGLAGCSAEDDTDTPAAATTADGAATDTPGGEEGTDRPEPQTREEYLQRANLVAHEQTPWLFLNRQYSVYGKSTDIEWSAPRNEVFDASAITPRNDAGEDVIYTQPAMDSGLDPQDHLSNFTNTITDNAYERLYTRDGQGRPGPELATDFRRIEDGRVEFTIREDVTFHNGAQLTPADVVYSIRRIIDEDVGGIASPQRDQLENIVGAEVTSTADRTVEVRSDGFNPVVFAQFATYCEIVNEAWIESNDTGYINQHMNGTGPFRLTNYEESVRVQYERFEDYWGDPPAVATLEINAASESSTRVNRLLSGESTVVANVPPQDATRVQENADTELAAAPSTRIIFAAMRDDVEPFDSPAFRRALNYAIDLDSIIENVLRTFGDPTGQPSLEGYVGYNPDIDPYPEDLDRAQALVEESGYTDVEIELHVPVGRYLQGLEIAQAATDQISRLEGVTASVEQREISSLFDQLFTGDRTDKPPWYMLGWGNPMFDASQWFAPLLTSGGFASTWSNDEFDRLVEAAGNARSGN